MSDHDYYDLFGDGDGGESLFANDGDSLFDGLDGDEQDQPWNSGFFAPGAAGHLTTSHTPLPSFPDPHGALSRGRVGHTSGLDTVSTQAPTGNVWGLSLPEVTSSQAAGDAQAFTNQHIDTFAVATHSHGDQAGHEQPGVTAGLSEQVPSEDGLMDEQESVSSDNPAHLDPHLKTEAHRNAEQPDEEAMRKEYQILRDQAARSSTSALGSAPADMGIDLSQTNYRWADASSRRGIRLPRRIDFEEAGIEVVKPYVTLNRGETISLHYQRLEVSNRVGADLSQDLKTYLSSSPDMQHLRQRGKVDSGTKKTDYLTASLRLLKNEGWGAKWFGPSSPTGAIRKLVWPVDSTLLVMRFAGLVYKTSEQLKERDRRARIGRRPGKASNESTQGQSPAMPIDLTGEPSGIEGTTQALTPNPSDYSSRPTSSHMSISQASANGMVLDGFGSGFTSRRPSFGLVPYSSPAFHGRAPSPRPDFYIMEEPAGGPATVGQEGPAPVAPAGTAITMSMLANHIADIKKRKQQQPPELRRPVKYRLTFTDSSDAQDLRPPVIGSITDDAIQEGKVFETISSAFSQAGIPATIRVGGPDGPVEVTNQDEWNKAVDAVWVQHGDRAVVHIGFHV